MGGGFLFRDVRWYSGSEGGAETVSVVVLVVVDYVACFGLFLFELDRLVLLFHCFRPMNLASGLWWAEFLDRLWCLLWWFVVYGNTVFSYLIVF